MSTTSRTTAGTARTRRARQNGTNDSWGRAQPLLACLATQWTVLPAPRRAPCSKRGGTALRCAAVEHPLERPLERSLERGPAIRRPPPASLEFPRRTSAPRRAAPRAAAQPRGVESIRPQNAHAARRRRCRAGAGSANATLRRPDAPKPPHAGPRRAGSTGAARRGAPSDLISSSRGLQRAHGDWRAPPR